MSAPRRRREVSVIRGLAHAGGGLAHAGGGLALAGGVVAVGCKRPAPAAASETKAGSSARPDATVPTEVARPQRPATAACTPLCTADACLPRPTAISLGRTHACVLDAEHRVACWGDNRDGQLGTDARSSYATPRWVELPDGFVAAEVDAGNGFTCVRSDEGRVHCEGLLEPWLPFADDPREIARACLAGELPPDVCDDSARLGEPRRGHPSTEPRKPIVDVAQMSTGPGGLCVRARAGGVTCHSMLGPREFPGRSLVPVPIAGTQDAVEVVGGLAAGCVRTANDEVACWRRDATARPMTGLGPVAALSMGYGPQACALRGDGTVACFEPGGVVSDVAGLDGVEQLDVGTGNSCARRGAEVWCWGSFADAWHEPFAGVHFEAPTRVEGVDAREVAAGGGFACALQWDGVRCWGSRVFGRTGDALAPEVASPLRLPLPKAAVDISADGAQTCAALEDGAVHCWGLGYAKRGELVAHSEAHHAIAGVSDAARVFVADGFGCARHRDGGVSCWRGASDPPRRIDGLADVAWVDPGPGYQCAALEDGSLRCFVTDRRPGVPLPGMADVAQVHSSSSDGFVFLDRAGGVGFATLFPKLIRADPLPAPKRFDLSALSEAVDVDAGGFVACAARRDGQVWCQRLAFASMRSKTPAPPSRIPRVDDAVEVSIADSTQLDHRMCFRRESGQVGCVGDHTRGALGDARLQPLSLLPGFATVANLDDAAQLAVGGNHGCARRRDGAVSCWGDDTYGQVSGIARGYAGCAVRVHAAREQ